MTEELKPCPFCGSKEALKISPPVNDPPKHDIILNSYSVVCRQCLCVGPNCANYEDMINRWNNCFRDENWKIKPESED